MATKSKPAKKAVKAVKKAAPAKKAPAKKVVKAVKKAAPKKVAPAKKAVKKPVPVKKAPAKKVVVAKKPVAKPTKQAPKVLPKKIETKAAAKPVVAPKPAPAPVKAKDIKVPAPKPVVIPKISTKTVRKYQPEFTKSVLDRPKQDPGAPMQRYTDIDLAEFKDLILRKLEAAKKELGYLQGLITRKDEMGGDETDNRYMTMEDGSLSMEREQLSQMASRQITFIDHLEKALMRIENKTYGVCRVTGRLIDKARLRAVPHATLSIEAKMSSAK